MDPAGYAAKIQNPPGHSKHDAVAYFILPLIDVAANDGDILQLAVTPNVPASLPESSVRCTQNSLEPANKKHKSP